MPTHAEADGYKHKQLCCYVSKQTRHSQRADITPSDQLMISTCWSASSSKILHWNLACYAYCILSITCEEYI